MDDEREFEAGAEGETTDAPPEIDGEDDMLNDPVDFGIEKEEEN